MNRSGFATPYDPHDLLLTILRLGAPQLMKHGMSPVLFSYHDGVCCLKMG